MGRNSTQRGADLTGMKFGILTVVSKAPDYIAPNGRKHRRFVCRCDCGNDVIVAIDNLKRTKSCGCIKRSVAASIGAKNVRHGDARNVDRARLYRIWSGMKSRCLNQKSPEYDIYGGRGIKICKEWVDDYPAFKCWAMKNGYSDELSIDRIDCNGDYAPDNCRWATAKEQSNNLRNNKRVVIDGVEMTIAQLSDKYKIPHHILLSRYNLGWSGEQILRFIDENERKFSNMEGGVVCER